MDIITTYGNAVYHDGTIKKQMEYQFTDKKSMIAMWNLRDTTAQIEWTMRLDELKITCVVFVKYGVDVHRYPDLSGDEEE